MTLDFVAIDFETANRHRSSPCSIGLARVRDGVVVKSAHWFMRPPVATAAFEQRNIDVHGITEAMVADAPRFGQRYAKILRGIGEDVIVAHNAIFDVGVLRAAAEADRLPVPDPRYVCTRDTARMVLPGLANYKLPTLAAEMGVTLDNHHDAAADAIAAAEVMIALAARFGWDCIAHLARTYPRAAPSKLYGQYGGRRRASAAAVPA